MTNPTSTNEALRIALTPFAALLEQVESRDLTDRANVTCQVSLSDIRRAHEVLSLAQVAPATLKAVEPSGETMAQREAVCAAWHALPDGLRKDARLTSLYHALGGPVMEAPGDAVTLGEGVGEEVAYQQLIDGKWVECSYFVAYGWGNIISPNCRPLYATPQGDAPKHHQVNSSESAGNIGATDRGQA